MNHAIPSEDVRADLRVNRERGAAIDKESWWKGQPLYFYHRLFPRDVLGQPELAPFGWDLRHPSNAIVATAHRFCRKMPVAAGGEADNFIAFTSSLLKHFPVVDRDAVPTFEQWLEKSNYGEGRKDVLRKLRRDVSALTKSTTTNKSFIKLEVYPSSGKLARAINSLSDESKAILGPLIHSVDKAFFSTRFFVKGTNPREWPLKLREIYGDAPVISTDFTSFESHHQKHFARAVHMWFTHMTSALDLDNETKALMHRLMQGRNEIEFKEVNVQCDERLMSGALWTSSANSFLNCFINCYLISKVKMPGATFDERARWCWDNVVGLCEGDDGLFVDYGQNEQDAAGLGCLLKFVRSPNFAGAGFCGIVCDPVALVVLKNPRDVWRKFALLPYRYAKARQSVKDELIRAKALSYYVSYRGCPIISYLCKAILDKTSHSRARADALDSFHMSHLETAMRERVWDLEPCVLDSSRAIVAEEFGITETEQRNIEAQITADVTRVTTGWGTSDDMWYVGKYVQEERYFDRTISVEMQRLLLTVGAIGPHKPALATRPLKTNRAFHKKDLRVPNAVRDQW